MSMRKGWLFTPGTRRDRFHRAAEVGADVLIMDLEDSVAPTDKDQARASVMQALASHSVGPTRAVRINALTTRAGFDDLAVLFSSQTFPDLLVVPKCEEPALLQLLDAWLTQAGAATGLVALVETADGVERVRATVRATPRLSAVMLGAADLAGDYGCELDAPNLDYARSRLVAAVANTPVQAIDTPWFDLHNDAGRSADLDRSLRTGFTGKASIHPAHIAQINQVFTPSAAEIEHARSVLAINDAGVGQLDGAMVDEAVARRARRTLSAAGLSTTP